MTAAPKSAPPAALASRRSGSQKRARSFKLQIALDAAERATAQAKAAQAGLSLSSFGRAALLDGDPGIRAQRAPTVNAEAIARATAALNKVGSNLNQVAHVLNAGRAPAAGEAEAALAEVRAILDLFREATGRKAQP